MDLRKTKLIQELREAREELLDINFATFTTTISVTNVSRTFTPLFLWREKWHSTFEKCYTVLKGKLNIGYSINNELNGYQNEDDPEILNEMRPSIIQVIDQGLAALDQTHEVRPLLLEDYIKRIKDTKLVELLKEFNAIKNIAPNHAAIGFRTILCLIIQEKAKRVNPTSNAATRIDLSPPMIDSAKSEGILSKDEQRLVDSFTSTHKDVYDLIVHRPGKLIDKSEVDTMVDLLNKLLPAIIN